jgi:hypothetical protein
VDRLLELDHQPQLDLKTIRIIIIRAVHHLARHLLASRKAHLRPSGYCRSVEAGLSRAMSSESSTPVASTSASALASATTSEASFPAGPTAGAAKATAKKVKEKKNVNVDPELIRRRREEKAVARQKAADAEEQAKANGEIPPERLQFIARELVDVSGAHANGQSDKRTLTIMTWNVSPARAQVTLLLNVVAGCYAASGSRSCATYALPWKRLAQVER